MDSDQGLVGPLCIVELGFELGRRNVSEVAVEAAGVVPVHPPQGGQLDVLDGLPGPAAGRSIDQLGLVIAVDGLRQSVIETVPDGADRGHSTDLGARSPYRMDVNCDPASE